VSTAKTREQTKRQVKSPDLAAGCLRVQPSQDTSIKGKQKAMNAFIQLHSPKANGKRTKHGKSTDQFTHHGVSVTGAGVRRGGAEVSLAISALVMLV
jgi:hypothetical protein